MGFEKNYFQNTNNIFNLKLQPNQFTILSYIIRMTNNATSCFPSMDNIAEMCCVSKSTVNKTIRDLKEAGYISVCTKKKYNEYSVNYSVIESVNKRNKEKCHDVLISAEKEREFRNRASIDATYPLKYIYKMSASTDANQVIKYNKKNKFNNFQQREYTKKEFHEMEKRLLEKGRIK